MEYHEIEIQKEEQQVSGESSTFPFDIAVPTVSEHNSPLLK